MTTLPATPKLIRIPKAEHPPLRRLLNSPVCILCARPAEAKGIADALGCTETLSGHSVTKVDSGHTFYLGSFQLQDGTSLDYYVTSVTRQGVQSFTVDASILFYILKPRHVIHAGVCAGYREKNFKSVHLRLPLTFSFSLTHNLD
jgi:hypothetical protein